MAHLTISNISIKAISACIPKHIERTADYNHITSEEQDLFIKTTGIKERRVADTNTTTSDLCYAAANDILEKHQLRDKIDVLIFVSQSPDYSLPASAIILQHKLQLNKNCIAFDINLGCSGYVYGLSIIGSLLQTGQLKNALLLVGDKSTMCTAYTDKSTYPLFGDAGSATLIVHNENSAPWHFNLQSDGSGKDAIIIEHGHCRHPYTNLSDKIIEIEPGIARSKSQLALNGMDIFNFALKEVSPNINSLLEKNNITKEQIDFYIFHQANKLINESVRKKLKIETAKTPYSIDVFGNTSSASIPLTLCYRLKNELQSKKLTLLLCGFGVGFSWGSVVMQTENIYTSIIEYAQS